MIGEPGKMVGDPGSTAEEVAAFMGWLNTQRKLHGLPSLIYDEGLSEAAFANNREQLGRGLGHWVEPPDSMQCVGEGTFDQVSHRWMDDPPHFNILMGRYFN